MATFKGLQADFFPKIEQVDAVNTSLGSWNPECWTVAPDWKPTLDHFLNSDAGRDLAQFIRQRVADGVTIYPAEPLRALALTPLASVRVVILGQDPYHGPGQAEGLAFSVAPGVARPPSLRNIFKELDRDHLQAGVLSDATSAPANGSLQRWARQGVLLINTCLTVERAQPASHANRGWEVLTDSIVRAVLENSKPVVFMLWGAHAQKLAAKVRAAPGRHAVLCANHPSPLSALRPPQPFIGCGHFSQANAFLKDSGESAVVW
ncbi:MAG: uracil-DNA glycosylase [Burkholderiales bacterium]